MKVQVYCYDLTRGMAAALSPMLLGYQIEAVWHTGVVIDGRDEVFFGYGISKGRAGATMFGQPARVLDMGESEVTGDVLEELLSDLAPRFRPQDYNLLFHNCNTFSNELVQLLTGEALPDYIMSQAEHLFNTPWGESLMPMIMAMEGFTGSATANGMATQQQQQQQHTAAQPAASSPPAAAPAAASQAASSSAAAVQVGVQAAEAAAASGAQGEGGDGGTQAGTSGVGPPTAAEARAASAAANAGMAAIARASQQQQQHEGQQVVTAGGSAPGLGGSDDAAAAAAGKAAEGVAGLSLTADSRAPQEQQQ